MPVNEICIPIKFDFTELASRVLLNQKFNVASINILHISKNYIFFIYCDIT